MDPFMENNGNGGLQAAVSDRIIDRDDLAPIESLPRELLYDIMSYLSTLDICRLMETSYCMWHSVLPQLVKVEEQSSNFLLGWATYNGHHRLMKSIIEAVQSKSDFSDIINRSIVCTFLPTVKNRVLETFPIHLAVMKNDAEAFRILAPITTNALCKDSDGRTLLHYSRVHAKITETALRWGLEPDEGDSPKPHKSLTALQRVLTYNERRLIGPVAKTTPAIVKTMLTQGNASPHKFADQNQSPLCLAFQHSPEMVEILLENGADPNFRSPRDISSDSEMALVIAAGLPDGSEIVRLLVEHGADVNGISGDTSPLMNAIQYGRVRSAEILLDAGANPNIYITDSNYGKSPLVLYMRQGAWSSVEALVSKGADLNFPPLNPLAYAAQFLLLQDVEKLLELGATPNPRSTSPGRSPYVSALCLRRRDKIYRRNAPEDHDAFEKERSAILDLLLEHGLELHTEDMSIDSSPLFQTLERGGIKELTRLLNDGANVNTTVQFRGFPGYTPLHYTLLRSEFKTDILLENGADPLSGYSETLGARDTPLGMMIWKRELAWSWEVWFRVIHFLGHEKLACALQSTSTKIP